MFWCSAGAIAPWPVIIQNDGLGSEKTSFFYLLSIQTRISKCTIEIINDISILKSSDNVSDFETTLLNMWNISSLSYGLINNQVDDSGFIFSSDILDIKPEMLNDEFQAGVANMNVVSLEIGNLTITSGPHCIANDFKNLLAIAAIPQVKFKENTPIERYIKNPSKFTPAASIPAASTAAVEMKEEAKKEESEEREDDDIGFGLFD